MQGETRTIKIKRVGPGVLAAGVLTAVGVGIVAMMPQASASPATAGVHKSYVCKYVSTPGEAERLQTGGNPIFVDNNSLAGSPDMTFVGESFSDGQVRSVVIFANTERRDPEPTVADCSVTPPATTTSTTTPATKTSTTTPATKTSTTSSSSTTSGTTGGTPPGSKPGGAGMPGSGAPRTGEVGAINPVNGLAALGLLGAAGALLAVRSRRHAGERRA